MTQDNTIDLIQLLVTTILTIWSTLYAVKANKKVLNPPKEKTENSDNKFKYLPLSLILSFIVLICSSILLKFKFDWITVLGVVLSSAMSVTYLLTFFIVKMLEIQFQSINLQGDLTKTVIKIADVLDETIDKNSSTHAELQELKNNLSKNKNKRK